MSARGRIETLLRECRKSEIDGVIILPGPNMRYLVDFTLETFERPAFLVAGFDSEPVLVVPRLDEDRARVAVSDLCEVRSYTDDTGPWKHVESVLHGFEGIAGVEGKMPV
ncbi:MAG: aminopeptidase P family N-terminal domain-containing protein, partial [Candidatus Caldarchaeum sp.]|nr:aminopeptidase P family N-terminal domain-containing protein [Candidatus Caldarchaeum sp.]MDW8436385.1 aminopeptidase P family N-terminal domain-containing protein [Candidatus Caldarchaeum sp.]